MCGGTHCGDGCVLVLRRPVSNGRDCGIGNTSLHKEKLPG